MTYSTTDRKLASVLKYAGYELTRIENEILDTRYYFRDPGDLRDLIRDYEAGQQGIADARSLLTVYEDLIHEVKGPEPNPQDSQLTGPTVQRTKNQCVATLAVYFGATPLQIEPAPNTHHGMLFTLELGSMENPVDLPTVESWFYAGGISVDPKRFWQVTCDIRENVRNVNHFGRTTYSVDPMRPKRHDPTVEVG